MCVCVCVCVSQSTAQWACVWRGHVSARARDQSTAVFRGRQGCPEGGQGLGLPPFIGFHIPEAAGLLSLSWLGRLAGQARGPPPRFLIPASPGMRRLERAPPHMHQATLGLEVGAGEGPVFS